MGSEVGITGNLFDTQEKEAEPNTPQPVRQLSEGFAQPEEKDDPYEDLGYRR
jgi:hypothetical protein